MSLRCLWYYKPRQRELLSPSEMITSDIGAVGCVVPLHKEVATGTLLSLLKQVKLSPEEFIEHLR
jgi:hypothetical protein